jgi:hypothetical protein
MSKLASMPRLKEIDMLSRVSQNEEKFRRLKLKPSSTPSESPSIESKTD